MTRRRSSAISKQVIVSSIDPKEIAINLLKSLSDCFEEPSARLRIIDSGLLLI